MVVLGLGWGVYIFYKHDANGKLIAEYTSIWRLEADNTWRIVFDKGNKACD